MVARSWTTPGINRQLSGVAKQQDGVVNEPDPPKRKRTSGESRKLASGAPLTGKSIKTSSNYPTEEGRAMSFTLLCAPLLEAPPNSIKDLKAQV
jgi:hypothetical protein